MVCVTADGSTTIAAAASAAGAVAAATTASSIVVAEGHEAIDRRSHRRAVPDAVSRVCPGGRRDTRPVRVDPLLRSPGEPSVADHILGQASGIAHQYHHITINSHHLCFFLLPQLISDNRNYWDIAIRKPK